MRFIEILGGLQAPVSNEEDALVSKIIQEQSMPKQNLDEREQEVARKLTSRGILKRIKIDGATHYKVNLLDNVWGL
jgi:hypothetical protein